MREIGSRIQLKYGDGEWRASRRCLSWLSDRGTNSRLSRIRTSQLEGADAVISLGARESARPLVLGDGWFLGRAPHCGHLRWDFYSALCFTRTVISPVNP